MDRDQLDMLLMLDEEEDPTALMGELFELFRSESCLRLNELDRICVENALGDLRKLVHFIAGSAGNLGLARLFTFYRAIECAIVDGSLTDISDAATPIREEFESSSDAFKAEFKL
jgi:HPt (histidine-containing phosphotransfer) domain-containing protein